MSPCAPGPPMTARHWLYLGLAGLVPAAGAVIAGPMALEALYFVFLFAAGIAMGSLGLLMIGHLMKEEWLAPVRTEAEAAALTMPLILLLGLPLAFGLNRLFPWAAGSVDLPPPRAEFLNPGFFLARSAVYLVGCSLIALWLIRTRRVRRTSVIGLALLAPIITFAAYDWVMSREPQWWSSLFGFAFAVSQLLAALAGAILVTLLRLERATISRMLSLERALLTLALLAIWTWFGQFVIVWLANLPHEGVWYLRRSSESSLALVGFAYAAVVIAIVILIPKGVQRSTMIAGSALVLAYHVAHMIWIVQPAVRLAWREIGLAAVAVAVWAIAFATLVRSRPQYDEESTREG